MIKKIKISGIAVLVLGFLCLGWWIFDIFAFARIKTRLTDPSAWGALEETLGLLVFVGFLVFFVFHIPALLTIIFRIQFFKKVDGTTVLALVLGLISLFGLMGDYSLLNDIGKESRLTGEVQSEWAPLYVIMILHALFMIVMIAAVIQTFRRMKTGPRPENVSKDEILFHTAHVLGLICGAVGLLVNLSFLARKIPPRQHVFLAPFYLLILVPYGLTVLAWLLSKKGENPGEWYDEKQWQDMAKGSLTALLMSVPGMGALLLFPVPSGLFWFVHFVFLILFLFSGSTLFFVFREKE